jgi:hypothetical protein
MAREGDGLLPLQGDAIAADEQEGPQRRVILVEASPDVGECGGWRALRVLALRARCDWAESVMGTYLFVFARDLI